MISLGNIEANNKKHAIELAKRMASKQRRKGTVIVNFIRRKFGISSYAGWYEVR